MEVSVRPWFTTGVALVGAGAIALTPISPAAPLRPTVDVAQVTAAVSHDVQLAALDWPYILSLPIVRQNIRNTIENWAVYLGGFAKAGVGLTQSLLAIPGVTVEAIQQVLALDFVGAFDTVATAIRDSVIAVGQPLLDSIIWRNQRAALVQAALSQAVPLAYLSVANGFLIAANGVTTAAIVGVQDFVAAVLSLNLANIVNAAVDGTRNFVVSLGAGAGAVVDGIETAQRGIVAALATTPPAPPTFAASSVSDVAAVSTFSAERTLTLSRSAAAADQSTADATGGSTADPVATAATPDVETAPEATSTPTTPAVEDAAPVTTPVSSGSPVGDAPKDLPKDVSDAVKEPVKASEPVKVSESVKSSEPAKETVKVSEPVKAASPGADKPAGPKGDDGAGAGAKSSSGGDGGES